MNSDDQMFLRKMNDRAQTAFYNGYPTFSDFLDMNEQRLLSGYRRTLPDVDLMFWGGYEDSERKIAGFFPKEYEPDHNFYPMALLSVAADGRPTKPLTHRDFLGSILNLGLTRSKIGDILPVEGMAYVLCEVQMAPFIVENLTTIRHEHICCQVESMDMLHNYTPQIELIKGTVSSLRLDSVVKLAFSLSRGHAAEYIEAGRVFVNSREIDKVSAKIEAGDIISVRGCGKFKVGEIGDVTKKGRTFIVINKYK